MALEGPNGFKVRSDAWYAGPRNKVVVIDNALAAYHANDATCSRAERLTALQGIIDLCVQYLALDPATTNATRRTGVTALRDEARQERIAFAALVDWDNTPASFKTENTENNFGDSEYTVSATGYQRYAPVNTVRAPNQVRFSAKRHFCYLTPGTGAYQAVMGSSDAQTQIVAIAGSDVTFRVRGRIYVVSIDPAEGDCPFDFDYDPTTGTIAHGHVGHELYDLQ
ncbi:MAG: hypothetical protein WEB13_04315 [Dehalococcoidia bacterium]